MLGDLLNQHPDIEWIGELYNPARLRSVSERWPLISRDPYRLLRIRKTMAGARCFGFETQANQLEQLAIPLPIYVERLESLDFSKFIVLERRNHLRRIVSYLVGNETARWHIEAGQVPPRIRINIDMNSLYLGLGVDTKSRTLVDHLQREQAKMHGIKKALADRDPLILSYEDDVAPDPVRAYRRVCRFCELSDRPAAVRLGKTNPYGLRDVISNYLQVADALSGTEYEWMLDG